MPRRRVPDAPRTAPAGGNSLRRRHLALLLATVALLAAAAAGYVVYSAATRSDRGARLPPLPDLSQAPRSVRTHLTDADRAARADPSSVEAVAALGLAYHADMFYQQAVRSYAVVETLSGASWRWTYFRALAQGEQGDAEGLAAGLRRVTAAAPDFGPAWWRLGEVEFKAGRYDAAAEAWRRVGSLPELEPPPAAAGGPARVPIASIAAHATFGLARIALIRGEPERARELLEGVSARAPRFGPAFRLLGDAYAALGRTADAARAVGLADRLPGYDPYVDPSIDRLVQESRSPTFLLQQAAATDVAVNAAWREHLIRRALSFDPENGDALYELASLLRVLRRYDEALALLERYRLLVPNDFQAIADIGRCLSGLRRLPEAEAMLRRALEGLDDANTRYDLGLVLDRSGRLPAAIVQYEQALEHNPNHRDALNNLGVALVRQGRLAQAAEQFERLVTADPGNADAHTNLGVVFLTQGARDLAAREFRAALNISPDHALAREGLNKLR